MAHREIFRLKWTRLAQNPWPKSKATGVKAEGLRFERAVGQALPKAKANVWVQYCDANGEGYCCPDYLLRVDGTLVVVECKLTDCAEAYTQLSRLYLPVFRHLCQTEDVRGVVVVKNLTRRSAPAVGTIAEALVTGAAVQWRGTGSLLGELVPFK